MSSYKSDTTWNLNAVAAFVARLRLAKYKVLEFPLGFTCEIDGLQVFRATNMGNEHFAVRLDERVFVDV